VSDERREKLSPRAREFVANVRALRASMHAWATQPGGIATGGGHEGYSELTFHWQTDPGRPRTELTLWADLTDDDRPVIRVSFPPGFEPRVPDQDQSAESATQQSASALERSDSSSSVAHMRGTGLPPVEPDQRCEACGGQGTVGRAIRFTRAGEIAEMHRFCAECWPEEQARYDARWRHQSNRERDAFLRGGVSGGWSGLSTTFESATWDVNLSMLDGLREHAMMRGKVAQRDLREYADRMFDTRNDYVGPMPFEIASFIAQYTSRTLPPDFLGG
jgi:hypothetical protein